MVRTLFLVSLLWIWGAKAAFFPSTAFQIQKNQKKSVAYAFDKDLVLRHLPDKNIAPKFDNIGPKRWRIQFTPSTTFFISLSYPKTSHQEKFIFKEFETLGFQTLQLSHPAPNEWLWVGQVKGQNSQVGHWRWLCGRHLVDLTFEISHHKEAQVIRKGIECRTDL